MRIRTLLPLSCSLLLALLGNAPTAFSADKVAMPANECVTSAGSAYGTACGTLTTTDSYKAARVDPGTASNPVDVWNVCRYIDNTTASTSYFAPFNTKTEWVAFITHHPDLVNLSTCSRPDTRVIVPDSSCTSPSPASKVVYLPYARTGVVHTETVTFSCSGSSVGCSGPTPTWTQTVTANYKAGTATDGSTTTSGWDTGTLSYASATIPPACTAGTCGPANGVVPPSAPSSGLCASGTASAVSGSGPWTWSCTGSNGGTTTNCMAPTLAVNGSCGPATSATPTGSAPTTGLCNTGTATTVTGTSPYYWSCQGSGSGTSANCQAPATPIDGVCGTVLGTVTASNACSAGTFGNYKTRLSSVTWTCAGINDGATASCSLSTVSCTESGIGGTSNPACASTCTAKTETRTSTPCPAGQTGVITEQRNYTCPAGTYTDWSTVSSTCVGHTPKWQRVGGYYVCPGKITSAMTAPFDENAACTIGQTHVFVGMDGSIDGTFDCGRRPQPEIQIVWLAENYICQ